MGAFSFSHVSRAQQLILGAGITPFSPVYSFSSLRLKAGVTNLVGRFGVYGMWELSPENTYGRDAFGINFQLNCVFRVWAGLGVFEHGLLNPMNKVNIWNGMRKEMGIGYISRYRPIQWELGYSFTLGPTFQFYYEIPLVKKDRNGDSIYNNVDRSIPCVLEWERRDTTVEIVFDTIYINPKPSRPICSFPISIDSFDVYTATNEVFLLPVAYEKNQVMLNNNIKEKIDKYLIPILDQRKDLIVEIGSHTLCDDRSVYNEQLSQRRADSIKRYLVNNLGLDPERAIAIGYGETQPVNQCDCEGGAIAGYTPYIDSLTKKHIPNYSREGKMLGYIVTDYSPKELDTFNGIPYVKCDIFQKEQNNRITLRFKRKKEHFKRILDSCARLVGYSDSFVYPKNCNNAFELGSIPYKKLNYKTYADGVYDLPINFERNNTNLEIPARDLLDSFAINFLKPDKRFVMEIGAHTDCRQSKSYNKQVSKRRADRIKDYLVSVHDIDSNRIVTAGYGEEHIVNNCNCEGSEVTAYTPFIEGYTKKLDVEMDARGNVIGSSWSEYLPREITVIEGNPYVACNDKQHRQNKRITLRIDTSYKNLCIDKEYIPRKETPKNENFQQEGIDFHNFDITKAFEEIFTLPIFYDLDKAIIRPDAQRILDTFAINIMLKYPDLIAELGSHTDCRMPYDYNERLAKRRADSAVAYLQRRWNIGSNRIVAKGYGETQLINECHCEDEFAVEYTPFIPGRTRKMVVDLDDEGNVAGTVYQEYDSAEIYYFGETPFVKCDEFQHRQNRRTTVRFTNNPEDFGIKIDVTVDANNTNVGESKFFERMRKGGIGHIREQVAEFKTNFTDIENFKESEALDKAYALPIFYDLDKAEIRPDAQKVLDSFAIKILLKYPKLVAELGSHTDCRMPYDYNVRLSKRRADSAVAYLLKTWKIDPKRIVAVGYGEHQTVNECACEATDATGFTPFIPGITRKMLVDLDDEGNVAGTVYQDYEPYEFTYIEGKAHVQCDEYQHRQNRRTTVRFANDPRDFGLDIDVDVDPNNVNDR